MRRLGNSRFLHSLRLGALVAVLLVAVVACKAPDDYRRAKDFFDQGDFVKAEEFFLKAAQKNPKDIRPLRKLALIYSREERYDDAVRVLQQAHQLDPQDGEVAARLAMALQKAARPGEAVTVAREALQLDDVQKDKSLRELLQKLVEELEGSGVQRSAALESGKITGQDARTTATEGTTGDRVTSEGATRDISPCTPLPTPPIKREDLSKLIPDDAPGRVIVRWRTETQEENLGFNIYRSENPDGPYERVNRSLIPGEGSTNIPKDYCFEDKPLPRGKVYYYYIESVSVNGVREILEGTKGTRVKVKTVEEEREWLWKKVMGEDRSTTPSSAVRPQLSTHSTRTIPTTPTSAVAYFTLKSDNESSAPHATDPLY